MFMFVYGTLMSGFHNNRLLKNSKLIGKATVNANMVSLGGFPAIYDLDVTGNVVVGELWEVPESDVPNIDALEGYRGESNPHNFYDRKTTEVLVLNEEGDTYKADVYTCDQVKDRTRVESGDWRAYVGHEGS